MAGFAIFIPGVTGVSDHLTPVGLGCLCRDSGPSWNEVLANGPGGGSRRGMYGAWNPTAKADGTPLCLQRHYEWTAAVADPDNDLPADRFYIGIDPANPPTPENLALKKQYPGTRVTLADGNDWLIPESSKLNMRLKRDQDGQMTRSVPPDMQEYFDLSQSLGRAICDALQLGDLAKQVLGAQGRELTEDVTAEVSLRGAYRFAVMSLSYNYRMCEDVADVLGLFDDSSVLAVVQAASELNVMIDVLEDQKKTTGSASIPVLYCMPNIVAD